MIEKLDSIFNDVRRKAFDSFRTRGERLGSDLEDWFKAERELFQMPESELKETETGFVIRAAVPGFTADDLRVEVLRELIVIEGKSPAAVDENEKVHFSEFGAKQMFRQYKLATPIDVSTVEATLDAGILKIVARKLEKEAAPNAIEVPIQTGIVKAPPMALAATAK